MKSSTAFMLTNMMKESVITDSYAKMINTNAYAVKLVKLVLLVMKMALMFPMVLLTMHGLLVY